MSHDSTHANVPVDLLGEAREIGDPERERRTHRRRLAPCALDRRGREVGREHVVAAQREADGLRADAAGAVEHALRRIAELAADQLVEHLALPAHGARPVGVQRGVVVGEVVVEVLRVHVGSLGKPLPGRAGAASQPSAMSSGRTGTRVSGRPLAARNAATTAAVETTVGGSPTPLAP